MGGNPRSANDRQTAHRSERGRHRVAGWRSSGDDTGSATASSLARPWGGQAVTAIRAREAGARVKKVAGPLPTFFTAPNNDPFDRMTIMTDEIDDDTLVHDMIEVHGSGAATVARENARTAALAGQTTQARSWIRVLGIIQRRQADHGSIRISPERSAVVIGNKNKICDSQH